MFFFFFNDTATTEIYTLSLHDALPISSTFHRRSRARSKSWGRSSAMAWWPATVSRSEEHTSELQSQSNLVCRLLLEKKTRETIFHLASISDLLSSDHHQQYIASALYIV